MQNVYIPTTATNFKFAIIITFFLLSNIGIKSILFVPSFSGIFPVVMLWNETKLLSNIINFD